MYVRSVYRTSRSIMYTCSSTNHKTPVQILRYSCSEDLVVVVAGSLSVSPNMYEDVTYVLIVVSRCSYMYGVTVGP